jgi:DNA-binding response OmpR family regulator
MTDVPSTVRRALIVVDDADSLRDLLVEIVRDAGLETVTAPSMADAVNLAGVHSVSVVIACSTDQGAVGALASRFPVIAFADSNWRWSAAELGVRSLLDLPFELEELDAALRLTQSESCPRASAECSTAPHA